MDSFKRYQPDFFVALLVLIFAVTVLVTAYTYSGGSGVFPRFIGWIFLGLALLEFLTRVKAVIAYKPSNLPGEYSSQEKRNVIKELRGFLWIGFLLLSLYLAGFMIGIPLYIFTFLRLSARRTLAKSATIAIAATAVIYGLFVRLLEYKLYQGIFMDMWL